MASSTIYQRQLADLVNTLDTYDRSFEAGAAPVVAKGIEIVNATTNAVTITNMGGVVPPSSDPGPLLLLEGYNTLFTSLGAMRTEAGDGEGSFGRVPVHSRHALKLVEYCRLVCNKDRVGMQGKAINVAVALEGATALLGRQRLPPSVLPLTACPHPVKSHDMCARLAAINFVPCLNIVASTNPTSSASSNSSSTFAVSSAVGDDSMTALFNEDVFVFLNKGVEGKDYRIRAACLKSLVRGCAYYNLTFSSQQATRLLGSLPKLVEDVQCTSAESVGDCGKLLGLALTVLFKSRMYGPASVLGGRVISSNLPSLAGKALQELVLSPLVSFFKSTFSENMTRRRQSLLSVGLGSFLSALKSVMAELQALSLETPATATPLASGADKTVAGCEAAVVPLSTFFAPTSVVTYLMSVLLLPEPHDEKVYGSRLFSKAIHLWASSATESFASEDDWHHLALMLRNQLENFLGVSPSNAAAGHPAAPLLISSSFIARQRNTVLAVLHSIGALVHHNLFHTSTDLLPIVNCILQLTTVQADANGQKGNQQGVLTPIQTAATEVLANLLESSAAKAMVMEASLLFGKSCLASGLSQPLLWVMRSLSTTVVGCACGDTREILCDLEEHFVFLFDVIGSASSSSPNAPPISDKRIELFHHASSMILALVGKRGLGEKDTSLTETCRRIIVPNAVTHLTYISQKVQHQGTGRPTSIASSTWKAFAMVVKTFELLIRMQLLASLGSATDTLGFDPSMLCHLLTWVVRQSECVVISATSFRPMVSVVELAAVLLESSLPSPSSVAHQQALIEFGIGCAKRAVEVFIFACRENIPCEVGGTDQSDSWSELLSAKANLPYASAILRPYSTILPTSLAQQAFAEPLRRVSKAYSKLCALPSLAAVVEGTGCDAAAEMLRLLRAGEDDAVLGGDIPAFNLIAFANDKFTILLGQKDKSSQLTLTSASCWVDAIATVSKGTALLSLPIRMVGEQTIALIARALQAQTAEDGVELTSLQRHRAAFGAILQNCEKSVCAGNQPLIASERGAISKLSDFAASALLSSTFADLRPNPAAVIEDCALALQTHVDSTIAVCVAHHCLRAVLTVLEVAIGTHDAAGLEASRVWHGLFVAKCLPPLWPLRFDPLVTILMADVLLLTSSPPSIEAKLVTHLMLQRAARSGNSVDFGGLPPVFLPSLSGGGCCCVTKYAPPSFLDAVVSTYLLDTVHEDDDGPELTDGGQILGVAQSLLRRFESGTSLPPMATGRLLVGFFIVHGWRILNTSYEHFMQSVDHVIVPVVVRLLQGTLFGGDVSPRAMCMDVLQDVRNGLSRHSEHAPPLAIVVTRAIIMKSIHILFGSVSRSVVQSPPGSVTGAEGFFDALAVPTGSSPAIVDSFPVEQRCKLLVNLWDLLVAALQLTDSRPTYLAPIAADCAATMLNLCNTMCDGSSHAARLVSFLRANKLKEVLPVAKSICDEPSLVVCASRSRMVNLVAALAGVAQSNEIHSAISPDSMKRVLACALSVLKASPRSCGSGSLLLTATTAIIVCINTCAVQVNNDDSNQTYGRIISDFASQSIIGADFFGGALYNCLVRVVEKSALHATVQQTLYCPSDPSTLLTRTSLRSDAVGVSPTQVIDFFETIGGCLPKGVSAIFSFTPNSPTSNPLSSNPLSSNPLSSLTSGLVFAVLIRELSLPARAFKLPRRLIAALGPFLSARQKEQLFTVLFHSPLFSSAHYSVHQLLAILCSLVEEGPGEWADAFLKVLVLRSEQSNTSAHSELSLSERFEISLDAVLLRAIRDSANAEQQSDRLGSIVRLAPTQLTFSLIAPLSHCLRDNVVSPTIIGSIVENKLKKFPASSDVTRHALTAARNHPTFEVFAWALSWMNAAIQAPKSKDASEPALLLVYDGCFITSLAKWMSSSAATPSSVFSLAQCCPLAMGAVLQAILLVDELLLAPDSPSASLHETFLAFSVKLFPSLLDIAFAQEQAAQTLPCSSTLLPQVMLLAVSLSTHFAAVAVSPRAVSFDTTVSAQIGNILRLGASKHAELFKSLVFKLGPNNGDVLRRCMMGKGLMLDAQGQGKEHNVSLPERTSSNLAQSVTPSTGGKLRINLGAFK